MCFHSELTNENKIRENFFSNRPIRRSFKLNSTDLNCKKCAVYALKRRGKKKLKNYSRLMKVLFNFEFLNSILK